MVKDSHPHWQFCHVDDLVSALVLAALGTVEGVVTVASDGYLSQLEVEAVTGLRRIELPARIAYGTAERLHRLGMTPAPASELAYTAEPWVVPSARLRAAGWVPRFGNGEALAALMAENAGAERAGGRRFGRDATLGAAGATVAVLGTAAVVRQIRRQRSAGLGSAAWTPYRLLALRDTPLSVDEVLAAVRDPGVGGTAVFIGTVRDDDEGRGVTSLGYSAHPSAADAMRAVAARAPPDRDNARWAASSSCCSPPIVGAGR